jgi:hypothetical protein
MPFSFVHVLISVPPYQFLIQLNDVHGSDKDLAPSISLPFSCTLFPTLVNKNTTLARNVRRNKSGATDLSSRMEMW